MLAEPIEVLATVPMGESLKVVGRGTRTGMTHDPILTPRQLAELTASAEQEPFDGDARLFRLYRTYADPAIWRQAVAKLQSSDRRLVPPDAEAKRKAGSDATSDPGEIAPKGEATPFLRQLVAEIPWGHNLLILNKLTDPAARRYYLGATTRFGWSRNVLLNQIKAGAYERAVADKKTHNFELALPEHLAEQADEMLKSRYNLEFLGIARQVKERELEERLIARRPHPDDPATAIEVCFIEVKGRAGVGEVALTNEYNTAERLTGDYWLYVVYNCSSMPQVHVIRNPARLGWKPVVKVEHYAVDTRAIIAAEEKPT